ncbi:putative Pre-mRNA-processing factor 19 protein, partial [Naja naja]
MRERRDEPQLRGSDAAEKKISNEVPEHPCLSPVSNHVYERRLIEKYIAENGTDPVNNQPLSEEQLLDIK